jgi:hypothetical protein
MDKDKDEDEAAAATDKAAVAVNMLKTTIYILYIIT